MDNSNLDLIDLSNLSKEELLELEEMTREYSSNETDSRFYLYQPNPVMVPFHLSSAKTRIIGGGNRSGKSESAVEEMAMQFLGRSPKSLEGLIPKHRLTGDRKIRFNVIDYPSAMEKITWPKVQDKIKSDDIQDVVKDMGRVKAITNKKGGFCEFMTYEQDVKKFQGTDRDAMFYDEEPPQSIRDENLMRLIDRDGEEVFSMTPVSEENSSGYMPTLWIYDELFLKAGRIVEIEEGLMCDRTNPTGDPEVHFFFASIFDNKAISKEAAERILSKFSKEEREAREKGHFMFLSGLIFNMFSDTIHIIPQFENWWSGNNSGDFTLYLAIDPHPRVPHAITYMVVDKYGILYIVDELYSQTNDADDLAEQIAMKCMGKIPQVILIDPSAFVNDPATGRCLAYDIMDALYKSKYDYPAFLEGSKDLSRGILQTKSALTPKVYCPKCYTPVSATLTLCGNCGEEVPADLRVHAKPRLYITSNCVRHRFEITHYRWSNWSKNTGGTKEVKQKPVDKDDHMMENMRRLVTFDPIWVPQIVPIENNIFNDARKGRNAITGY